MTIKERFFLIGEEWNVIHLPKKPNGFAIFIIGDINHFVNSKTSSWHQRPDHYQFIEDLKNAGYTVIYSNLYGRHWGSAEACHFLHRIYDEVTKKEILNKKVHIIAEGMGALVAAQLIPTKESSFRSIVMINPCLNLSHYFQTEKRNKFFYKRFLKELKRAYSIETTELEKKISSMDINMYKAMPVPLKILHCMNSTPYTLENHVRPYEKLCNNENNSVEVAIFLKNKPFEQLAKPAIEFFKKNECNL
ncbi:hypothetical protein BKP37_18140 [Anaerobacillus alkalilacustris]|uniref:Alpha/beta hydrolase n=1 Tax=Anaerobacillus alkalilacustris TaxID=393763 RepID=A0A1S2LD96_9BACI|nr:hypothetical protein [Anaerobacillus alkalilacustris]OIJ10458.1 hypothetical protein BKP37_18140 [Anaerobacillus alkalilacustris]